MTVEEIGHLLGVCAGFDRRTVGETDIHAWFAVLSDLPFSDARDAVLEHYRDSRDWIMPADIRTWVNLHKAGPHDRRVRDVLGPRRQPDPPSVEYVAARQALRKDGP